jgi:AcrR family transcriptional regulator
MEAATMPRPRFNKLSAPKRERILEAAAREFAAHGYEGASLNQILAEAEISKGAAYYYFDDKADLYATAVAHYAAGQMADLPQMLAGLTAETFWPTLHLMYRQQFRAAQEQPWVLGLVKSAARLTPAQVTEMGLADTFGQLYDFLTQLVGQGQQLGVIRTDLPQTLLIQLFMNLDDALDQWLLANWPALSAAEIEQIAAKTLAGMERLLAPQ